MMVLHWGWVVRLYEWDRCLKSVERVWYQVGVVEEVVGRKGETSFSAPKILVSD